MSASGRLWAKPAPIAGDANLVLSMGAALERMGHALLLGIARKLPYKAPPFWKGQAIGLLCAAAGLSLRLSLTPLVHASIPVVLFYPFVLLASVWGGSFAGLTVLIVCAGVADILWLPAGSQWLTLTAFSIACLSVIVMAQLFRTLVALHAEGEERAVLLAHELKHRAGNLFGVVQAISSQTARHAASVGEHQTIFSGRLMALARAQQLVWDHQSAAPDLHGFLRQIAESFGPDRFVIDGPVLTVPRYLGNACALLLHELCTNATKYGALSVPGGMVRLTWQVRDARVRLEWREVGGPPVAPPSRAGFGTRLLHTAFPPEFGTAELQYRADGVECILDFALV